MSEVEKRLRNLPFSTEAWERKLMLAGADEIATLQAEMVEKDAEIGRLRDELVREKERKGEIWDELVDLRFIEASVRSSWIAAEATAARLQAERDGGVAKRDRIRRFAATAASKAEGSDEFNAGYRLAMNAVVKAIDGFADIDEQVSAIRTRAALQGESDGE